MNDLDERYNKINEQIAFLDDFQVEELEHSRNLFQTVHQKIVPRHFEVWTCVAGLPVPIDLASNFLKVISEVTSLLPNHVKFYSVLPENYHWEIIVIKRPNEFIEEKKLLETSKILDDVIRNHNNSFSIEYKGFLITGEGTIIAKGYGGFDPLRGQMHIAMPFASPKQSKLGHISLGRILDPVGPKVFRQLKQLVYESETIRYGNLPVKEIKYIHETQWYMESHEIISTIPLG